MFLGYNTNGFAFHRLEDALAVIADLGYQGVGLTLDVHHLDPFRTEPADLRKLHATLERLKLRVVVETGARFLLDARRKHQPTLLSPSPDERRTRVDFLVRATNVAAELGSDCLSFWSGTPIDDADTRVLADRLDAGLRSLLEAATKSGVRLALEPEPGMLVESTADGLAVLERLNHPRLGLTIDVGHIHCLDEGDPADVIRRVGPRLFNVHIEDMKRGVHDHLMFGAGEMNFPPIFAALGEIGYTNGVYVELSRHSHDAVRTAEAAERFLRPLLPS